MAKAWKDAIPVGVIEGPEGPDEMTHQRCRQLVSKLQAIRKAGNKVPVPWVTPKPGCNDDECAYVRSRFNAGHVEDARFDAKRGMVQLLIDVPGARAHADGELFHTVTLPNNRQVDVRVGEIENIGLSDWTDGQGRTWTDVITFAAIQPGASADASGYKTFLSTFVDSKMPTLTTLSTVGSVNYRTGSLPIQTPSKPAAKQANLSTEERTDRALRLFTANQTRENNYDRIRLLRKAGVCEKVVNGLATEVEMECRGLPAAKNPGRIPAEQRIALVEKVVMSTPGNTPGQIQARRQLATLPPLTSPFSPTMSSGSFDEILKRNGLGDRKPALAGKQLSTAPARKLIADPDDFCRRNGVE